MLAVVGGLGLGLVVLVLRHVSESPVPTAVAADLLLQGEAHRLGYGWLTGCQFSRDGTTLAVATSLGVELRSGDDLTLRQMLRGHSASSAALSPTGERLVSGSHDGTLFLWDLTKGGCVFALQAGGSGVEQLAFSPDGRVIASGHLSGEIKLWDPTSGKLVRTLRGHKGTVKSVAFGPEPVMLASVSVDDEVRVWDFRTGRLLRRFQLKGARYADFSDDGAFLLVMSNKQVVRLRGSYEWFFWVGELVVYETAAWEPVHTIQWQDCVLRGIAVSRRYLAVGVSSYNSLPGTRVDLVEIWDLRILKKVRTIPVQEGFRALALSPCGRKLAVLGKEVTLWDTLTGAKIAASSGHTSGVRALEFSPDGRWLMTGGWDEIVVWDLDVMAEFSRVRVEDPVDDMKFSADGSRLAVGCFKDTYIYRVDGPAIVPIMTLGRSSSSVSFSPDGRWVATSRRGLGEVTIWDTHSGRLVRSLLVSKSLGADQGVQSVEYSPGGHLLVVASWNSPFVSLWSPGAGSMAREFKRELGGSSGWVSESARSACFSPDGKIIAASQIRSIVLWEVASGRMITSWAAEAERLVFSPDSRFLASCYGKKATLWSVVRGERIREFVGHTAEITSLAFSADGRFLATGSEDGTVVLWELGPISP